MCIPWGRPSGRTAHTRARAPSVSALSMRRDAKYARSSGVPRRLRIPEAHRSRGVVRARAATSIPYSRSISRTAFSAVRSRTLRDS